VNVASMIGLGTVRGTVVGQGDRPATPAELARMVGMVEKAVANGAAGASSGLEYPPSGFARPDELVALCRPLAARGLPYATHMRNEDDRLLESIDESIAVARGAGCPLEVSHLKAQGPRNWDKMGAALARLDAARAAGLDAAFDIYPYVAYATGLANLFPLWSRDGGTARFLLRLGSDSLAARLRAETEAKVSLIGGWDNVLVSSAPSEGDQAAVGMRLGRYARSKNADPYETTVALLQSHKGQTGMVGFAMSEENVERGLAHPLASVCSDGGAVAIDGPTRRGRPHPRSVGTFPRVLGRYVRERKTVPLQAAIHKMTARPAARVKLGDRGRIAAGMAADLVAFDPATVADRSTFEDPFQYPVGIEMVMVNGEIALQNGKRTESRAGKVLRPA
jgi:N-acyl-D-amino-acid deacylase